MNEFAVSKIDFWRQKLKVALVIHKSKEKVNCRVQIMGE